VILVRNGDNLRGSTAETTPLSLTNAVGRRRRVNFLGEEVLLECKTRPLRNLREEMGIVWGISIRGRFGLDGPSERACAANEPDELDAPGDGCHGDIMAEW
jgi:hypothetical protein